MIRPVLALVLLATSLVACSRSTADRLVGTWHESGDAENTITFAADGELRQVANGVTYTATWTTVDESTVEIRFTGESERLGTTTLSVDFAGDGLTTVNAGGRQQSWKR